MMELHGHVAAVVAQVLGDETTAAKVITDTVIPVADTVDFSEDGGHVRILGDVYEYVSMDDGEESGAPSITLEAPGLLGSVPAETTVEVWNPNTSTVVTEWKVDVTDDTDGSTAVATLSHALIAMVSDGMPLASGDSVTVRVPEGDGEWTVVDVHGKRPYIKTSLSTAVEGARVEVGEGEFFEHPTQEMRLYTGDVFELGPAEVRVESGGGGNPSASLLIQTPEWDGPPSSQRPSLLLDTGNISGTQISEAILEADEVSVVAENGRLILAASTVINAGTFGTGDVGTGTFRDSVDARVVAGAAPAASTTTSGIVELATSAETITGTDTVRAVTPAGLRAELDETITTAGSNANFNAITNPRNTTGKYAGRPGWNTTIGKPIWATGSTAGSTWVDATGAVTNTPV